MAKTPHQELIKKINQAKPEKLKSVLLKMSSMDPQMTSLILAIFNDTPVNVDVESDLEFESVPDPVVDREEDNFPQVPKMSQAEIDQAIRHYRGVISNELREQRQEPWTFGKISELEQFFANLLGEVSDQYGRINVPFELGMPLVLMIIKNQMKIFGETNTEESIYDSLNDSFIVLARLVDAYASRLGAQDKIKYMEQVLKLFKSNLFHRYDDIRYDFVTTTVPLATPSIEKEILTASENLVKKAGYWDNGDLKDFHGALRLNIALTDGNMTLAREIVSANPDNEVALDELITYLRSTQNFDEAEQLAINAPRDTREQKQKWDEVLSMIYMQSGESEKLLTLTKQQLMSHQKNIYGIYKRMLEQRGEWDKAYPELMTELEENLTRYEFGDILVTEENYPKLFEQLEKYHSAPMIRHYLEFIYPEMKKKMTDLYYKSVILPDTKKSSPSSPKQLSKDLTDFLKVSKDRNTVQTWLNQLTSQLAKKPKFLEILPDVQRAIELLNS